MALLTRDQLITEVGGPTAAAQLVPDRTTGGTKYMKPRDDVISWFFSVSASRRRPAASASRIAMIRCRHTHIASRASEPGHGQIKLLGVGHPFPEIDRRCGCCKLHRRSDSARHATGHSFTRSDRAAADAVDRVLGLPGVGNYGIGTVKANLY